MSKVDDHLAMVRTVLGHAENRHSTYLSLDQLAHDLRAAADALDWRARGRSSHPPAAVTGFLDAFSRAQDESTLVKKIGAVSELSAHAESWMLQLIGEALGQDHGPTWSEIGQVLKKVDRAGAVVPDPLTRQGARQRYADYVVVERHRLETKLARLRARLSALREQESSIRDDPSRNEAEVRRDLDEALTRRAEIESAVAAIRRQLDVLHDQPDA